VFQTQMIQQWSSLWLPHRQRNAAMHTELSVAQHQPPTNKTGSPRILQLLQRRQFVFFSLVLPALTKPTLKKVLCQFLAACAECNG
jgi:hypothetical protein